MRAVCWAVRNRVVKPGNTWWGDDWEEVILKRWQFTSFEKSDPNVSKLPGDPSKDPSWQQALEAAYDVYRGVGDDITQGATHYYNPDAVLIIPTWVKTATFKCRIGKHMFYQTL